MEEKGERGKGRAKGGKKGLKAEHQQRGRRKSVMKGEEIRVVGRNTERREINRGTRV